jgi:hypothetical protein
MRTAAFFSFTWFGIVLLPIAASCGGSVVSIPSDTADPDASTDAPFDANAATCPVAAPSGSCRDEGLQCRYGGCFFCSCQSGTWSCVAPGCAGGPEPEPVEGAVCGTGGGGCCGPSNPSHVGDTRTFACPNGGQGTAVCKAAAGGAGTWHVTATCPVVAGTCSFSGDPSPQATSSYGACGEGVNITSPPSVDCGGAGAAFEYVPLTDVAATRIELSTTPGTVAILDSDASCDKPGATLFQGDLDGAGSAIQWRGADIFPPLHLAAHHKYFMFQAPGKYGSMACSVAQKGVQVREYTGAPGGPWQGPFGGLNWMWRVVGACP